jgi:hypothetical protein
MAVVFSGPGKNYGRGRGLVDLQQGMEACKIGRKLYILAFQVEKKIVSFQEEARMGPSAVAN